jgi:hypothetical protein
MGTKHRDEVVELMGAIAHIQLLAVNKNAQRDQVGRAGSSPCEHLLRFNSKKIRTEFVRDFCAVNNLNVESPLAQTIEASVHAIPKIAKVRKIIAKDGCKVTKELPIEIDLGDKFKFHDIFICPVAKEAAVGQNTP